MVATSGKQEARDFRGLGVAGRFPPLPRGPAARYKRAMPTVGDQLRMERERRKLTVRQVADATNIKSDHVRALEASEWSAFAAPVYIRGFTRTYARHLRLDDKALVETLDGELELTADYSAPPSLPGPAKGPLDTITLVLSRLRWQWLFPLILGGLVIVLGVWGYRVWQGNATAARKVTPLGSGLRPAPRTAPATLALPTNPPAGRR